MKVIVAGSRDFDDKKLLYEKLDFFLQNCKDVEIVSGGTRGADRLGEEYAKDRGYGLKRFPAYWQRYGPSAGYRRNQEMAQYGDACAVFWDGKSKGTHHMIRICKEKGLKLRVVMYT